MDGVASGELFFWAVQLFTLIFSVYLQLLLWLRLTQMYGWCAQLTGDLRSGAEQPCSFVV